MTTHTYYLSDDAHPTVSNAKKLVTSGQTSGSLTADYGTVQARVVVYSNTGALLAASDWQAFSTTSESTVAVSKQFTLKYTSSNVYLGIEIKYDSAGSSESQLFLTGSVVSYGIDGTHTVTLYMRYRELSDPSGGTIQLNDVLWGADNPSSAEYTEYTPPPVTEEYSANAGVGVSVAVDITNPVREEYTSTSGVGVSVDIGITNPVHIEYKSSVAGEVKGGVNKFMKYEGAAGWGAYAGVCARCMGCGRIVYAPPPTAYRETYKSRVGAGVDVSVEQQQ